MDLSLYMNELEIGLEIGNICIRDDLLFTSTEYKVLNIVERDNKVYAVCEYKDEFDDSIIIEEIYVNYLRRI